MASLAELIESGKVCRCLRTKELFYDCAGEDDAGGPFWCAHTQSLLGPDGQVADADRCRDGRSCCELA